MAAHPTDVVVVGGGIVGLATAWTIARGGARVTVLEKERAVGRHQTGRNSGVVHAGIYSAPGSLQARLCTTGRPLLRDFALAHGVPYDECGKLIVARDERELDGLADLQRRAEANGVPDVRWVASDAIADVEPSVRGAAALHSPHTAITDFGAVAEALCGEIAALGGRVLLGTQVTGFVAHADDVEVVTSVGSVRAAHVVTCAGLWSDRVARLSGDVPAPRIIPFRGDYYRLGSDRAAPVRGLVYPVPDPRLPFLGVHLTRTVAGDVLVGPNAFLAFAREGYRLGTVRPKELAATVGSRAFRRLARQHWRTGASELRRALSKRAFAAEARAYVPGITAADLTRAPSGVRAQAVDDDGSLVDDFRITQRGRILNVRNAPSPAATSSLAIADEIVARLPD